MAEGIGFRVGGLKGTEGFEKQAPVGVSYKLEAGSIMATQIANDSISHIGFRDFGPRA